MNSEQIADTVRSDEDWLLSVEFVRAHYAEDIFPPESQSTDARSASLCRLVCDSILKIATDRAKDRGADGDGALSGTVTTVEEMSDGEKSVWLRRRLNPDAPAPSLEGGDWGFVSHDDLPDGCMGEASDLGDGAER